MKIKCVAIGKTSGSYAIQQVQTYVKRIERYLSFELIELKEIKHNKNKPEDALILEEKRILTHIQDRDTLILFDEKGQHLDSKSFAQFITKQMMEQRGILVFCLGGAYGFSESLRKRAKGLVSLSAMTFPHQLARVIALEQLYRACTIINRHPYHHS